MINNPTRPDAIFFDLGMVLFTFDWNIAIPRFAARNGGNVDRVKQFLADPYHDAFERNELTSEEFFGHGREIMGFEGSQSEFRNYWNEIFAEIPQNVQLLQELAAHYPVYALSNTNPWHAAYLEQSFDWMDIFRQRFYSFTLGARKPDPKIYRGALERAGLDAKNVLFIDDKPENIETARDLGFQTVHLASPEQLETALQKRALIPALL